MESWFGGIKTFYGIALENGWTTQKLGTLNWINVHKGGGHTIIKQYIFSLIKLVLLFISVQLSPTTTVESPNSAFDNSSMCNVQPWPSQLECIASQANSQNFILHSHEWPAFRKDSLFVLIAPYDCLVFAWSNRTRNYVLVAIDTIFVLVQKLLLAGSTGPI